MPFLTDKSMCSDALSSQKFLADCYNLSITEATDPQLRQDFLNIYQEEQNIQRQVFDAMASRRWYTINQASPQEVNQLRQMLEGEIAQVNQLLSQVGPQAAQQMGQVPLR